MNIEEYISSGILEAYALGELSANERAEVEKYLLRYPQLKQELARIEEAQEAFLMHHAKQPHAVVRENLFRKLDSRPEEKSKVSTAVSGSPVHFWKYAAAASIMLALVSSYLAFNYHSRWRSAESSLSRLMAQNQQIAKDYNAVNQRLDQLDADIQVMNNPAFTRVVMKGTENAPGAMASVYWNTDTKEVYLSIQNMKALAQQNQYQLWAIVDGKPVDAGVFDATAGKLLKMKELSGATAFAVTIEPRGGKTAPSLETLQVIGNVAKG